MVTISLKDFVQTGRFGSVALGQSRAHVRSFLGEPDDLGGTSRKHRKPAIWKYGSFEFSFPPPGDSLTLIHADHFDIPSGGRNVIVDPWIIRGDLPQDDLERELGKAGFAYQVREEAYREALLIETVSGVQFGYHLGAGEAPPATALQFISLSRQESPL